MTVARRAAALATHARSASRALETRLPRASRALARVWGRAELLEDRRCFTWTTAEPEAASEKALAHALATVAPTAFGRDHELSSVDDLRSYRRKVPIVTYDDMRPYMDRIVEHGEADVLAPGLPRFLKRSSGSTGRVKYVPHFADDDRPRPWLGCYAWPFVQRFPDAIHGKQLFVTSMPRQTRSRGGVSIGAPDPSERGSLLFPPEIMAHAIPLDLYYVGDTDLRLYCILRLAAQEDVRVVAVVNPATAVVFAQKLAAFASDLAADLRAGTCARASGLPEPMRRTIEGHLRCDLAAADRIKDAMRGGGSVLPTHLWPKLRVLFSWLGGSAALYRPRVGELFPGVTCWDPRYSSVEGRFASMPEPESPSGVVNLWRLLPEFVEENVEVEAGTPTLLAHELERGRRYKLVVTNPVSGLYRYYTSDIVECDGFYDRAPRIRFVSRDHGTLSFTGEKVTEAHAVEAIRRVQVELDVPVEYAVVSAEFGDPPRYVLAIESAAISDDRLADAGALFDRALCAVNDEYEQKRSSHRLARAHAIRLPHGTAERLYRKRLAQGAVEGRVKLPAILRDTSELKVVSASE